MRRTRGREPPGARRARRRGAARGGGAPRQALRAWRRGWPSPSRETKWKLERRTLATSHFSRFHLASCPRYRHVPSHIAPRDHPHDGARIARDVRSARPVRAHRPPASSSPRRVTARRVAARAAPETGSSSDDKQAGAGLKAVWYGAEAVGKVVGATKAKDDASPVSSGANAGSNATASSAGATLTRARALELLREDYDEKYFVSGAGALAAYDSKCEFSDPFVAFEGVDRFKQNVGNLGGMMRDIDLKITGWEENEDTLVTSWRFSCVLDLPWRPKLAAAGGTTHAFDRGTGKVVKHIERWDVDPGKVVKQLLVPASKLPENRWEVFMFSLADGDAFGCWLAASPGVVKLTAPWVAVSVAAKAAGISAEGTPLGTVDALAFWLLVLALVAEPVRFFKGIIGS